MNPTDSRHPLRADRLPALSVAVRRALSYCGESGQGVGELAQLVEIHPVLTGAVMRVARCPVYGLADAAIGLGAALEMIGPPVLQKVFRALPRVEGDDLRAAVERACRHWIHAVAVAAASRWLSNQGEYEAPDDAYLAGLVHDVGRAVSAVSDSERTCARRSERIVSGWGLGARVSAVARFHHRVGDASCPETICADGEVLDDATRRLLRVVARGSAVAVALGFEAEASGPVLPKVDDVDSAVVREAIALELAHAARLLGLGEVPAASFLQAVLRAEMQILDGCDTSEIGGRGGGRGAAELVEVHRELRDARRLATIPEIVDRGLRSIHERLGFDRLLLLEREPDHADRLRSKLVLDPTRIAFPRGLGGVEVPIDPEGALAQAIDADDAILASCADGDAGTFEHLGIRSLAASPLRAGQAGMGIVVADQFFTRRPLTEEDAAVLGLACASLGFVLENAALDAQGKKLRQLAEKDELTGISNRRQILAVLQREIDRARRYGKPLSVAMIDVDHFKTWNDLHGHQVGDTVLQAVAQLISSCSREIDAHGRLGGEEFVVVLPETSVEHAVLYAERLRTVIETHGQEIRAYYPHTCLSVSIGVTSLAPRNDDLERIIHRADAALYAAKHHGRNRVCVEGPGDSTTRPLPVPPIARGLLGEL